MLAGPRTFARSRERRVFETLKLRGLSNETPLTQVYIESVLNLSPSARRTLLRSLLPSTRDQLEPANLHSCKKQLSAPTETTLASSRIRNSLSRNNCCIEIHTRFSDAYWRSRQIHTMHNLAKHRRWLSNRILVGCKTASRSYLLFVHAPVDLGKRTVANAGTSPRFWHPAGWCRHDDQP